MQGFAKDLCIFTIISSEKETFQRHASDTKCNGKVIFKYGIFWIFHSHR